MATGDVTAKMAEVSVGEKDKAAEKEAIFQSRLSERLPYYAKRVELFEGYYTRELAKREAAQAANEAIKVIMPDGAERPAVKGFTTPYDIAAQISNNLAKKCVVAKVDGDAWDMSRPLEGDCALQLVTFDDRDGKDTFWHSSAHVLGEALELEFGVDLTIGPPIEEGFYYDCHMGDATLAESDLQRVEKRVSNAIKEKQPFQRITVSREEALAMFQENKFKIELIENLPADAVISVYRVGPMVDLCSGPHVPDTSMLKAVALTSCSRAFWRADTSKDALQRVYAITFPDNKQLKEYQHRIAEAKKRDHRLLGQQYTLFFFHPLSPGSCFFQPLGARIYNNLVGLIKEKYWEYEYDEVMTPNMYNFDLWKISGHADHYKENMFSINVEKQEFGLKPMNCPGHCLMFNSRVRSYRDLPLRMADFGVLHRNEFSGALHGLTRVRRFQQDDAHIFCRSDQVMQEVSGFLKMMGEVYGIFGLDYEMALSTRPESYLGEIETWNKAEASLTDALNSTGREWKENPEDGAFYGPKIDITVLDALKRRFQCATVQLDFQLPIRFDLTYMTEETGVTARPVIVHRAILGSVERMFAILTEHYAGKWPLWLSPRQVMVVPISGASFEYAEEVRLVIRKAGFFVDADCSDRKMQKKVREAQLEQYNYILVVGAEEAAARTVNVRTRDNKVHGMHKLEDVLVVLQEEKGTRSLTSSFGHGEEEAK